jgi:NitT/TauT family transport system permease protein
VSELSAAERGALARAAGAARTGRFTFLRHRLERVVVPVLLLVLWEAVARSGWLPRALLPAPSLVAWSLLDWVFGIDESAQAYSGHWYLDAAASAFRVFSGFAIAAVSATVLGIAIGWSRLVERTIEPTIQLLRPVPPVSWIPLAIVWFGVANKPAIFLVFLATFFPILINTIHGTRTIDRNLIRAAAMVGTEGLGIIRFVVLPAALPSIMAGLRISIGIAWMVTVTAEMLAVKSGLGYVLWDSYYFLRYDLVMAAMASIGLLGFLSDLGLKRIMAIVLHWQRGATVEGLDR